MSYGSVNVPGDLSGKQDLITGVSGQVVGIGTDGKAAARDGWSNPNLLLNRDFRNPVNRNGQTEYTTTGYTIDRWFTEPNIKVSVEDGFIQISRTISTGNPSFRQDITNPDKLNGKTVTLSILYRSNCSANFGFYINDGANMNAAPVSLDWNVVSLAVNLPEDICSLAVRIPQMLASEPVGSYFDIQAAKLEPGGRQTLARQNEDGEWELIDPPDYGLQYLLCSQYSPITGEWVGSQHSNPNLLDNGYFADPINQRGQAEYIGYGYTIDRWRTLTVHLSLNLPGNCIRLGARREWPNDASVFAQYVESPIYLIGKQLTLSFLVGEIAGNTIWKFVLRGAKQNQYVGSSSLIILKTGLNSLTFSIPSTWDIDELGVRIHTANSISGDYIDLIAAKLELGPVQTLAHKEGGTWVLNDPPPDKALELAKCQRYFQLFSDENLRPVKAVDFRPTMRVTPALGTIVIDGTTYYTADANL